MTLEEFFTNIYDKTLVDKDGCRIYNKSRARLPIGVVQSELISISGKTEVAARLVLERKLGRPIKLKHMACHTCDRPRCISEEHVYEGTFTDNVRDRNERNPWFKAWKLRPVDKIEREVRRLSAEQRQILYEVRAKWKRLRDLDDEISLNI